MMPRGAKLLVDNSADEADTGSVIKQKISPRKQNKLAAQPLVLEQQQQSA